MKVLFLHDHRVFKDGKALYSRGGLSRKVMMRYIGNDNKLTLVTRELKKGNVSSMTLLSSGDISFVPLSNLASPNIFNYINAYKKLKLLIEENDVFIVRLPSFIGIFSLFFIKDKKVIIELVGCPWDSLWNYSSISGKITAPIQWLLTKIFVKKAENVIYVTSEFLQKRYPSKANNLVGCSDVEIMIEKGIFEKRKRFIESIEQRVIKIGMIGNLEARYKGFDTAIESISLLDNKDRYILEIVGGGNSDYVNGLILKYNLKDNVKIIGTLSHPVGINNWLDQIDIFIQPSRLEGLPRALVEALSRGCACIGTDTGGIPELLKQSNIIKKHDSHGLAKLISYLSSVNTLLEEMEYSLKKAKEFDKDLLEKRRVEFYNNAGIYDEIQK